MARNSVLRLYHTCILFIATVDTTRDISTSNYPTNFQVSQAEQTSDTLLFTNTTEENLKFELSTPEWILRTTHDNVDNVSMTTISPEKKKGPDQVQQKGLIDGKTKEFILETSDTLLFTNTTEENLKFELSTTEWILRTTHDNVDNVSMTTISTEKKKAPDQVQQKGLIDGKTKEFILEIVNCYLMPIVCPFGVVGNILSLVALLCIHKGEKSTTVLLVALTFSDLGYLLTTLMRKLSCVASKVDPQRGWWLNIIFLPQVFMLTRVFNHVTAFTTVIIAVERMLAVYLPFKKHEKWFDWFGFLNIANPQQGDLRLSGPPSGQGTGGGARTRDRRVPANLRSQIHYTTDTPMKNGNKVGFIITRPRMIVTVIITYIVSFALQSPFFFIYEIYWKVSESGEKYPSYRTTPFYQRNEAGIVAYNNLVLSNILVFLPMLMVTVCTAMVLRKISSSLRFRQEASAPYRANQATNDTEGFSSSAQEGMKTKSISENEFDSGENFADTGSAYISDTGQPTEHSTNTSSIGHNTPATTVSVISGSSNSMLDRAFSSETCENNPNAAATNTGTTAAKINRSENTAENTSNNGARKRSKKTVNSAMKRQKARVKGRERKLTKMLTTIAVIYVVCHLPTAITKLANYLEPEFSSFGGRYT
ncbi:neuropeptides capa receptor [Plakobranchus ocellatus]|uniref:Neuropeptides capa receptor n=1 Tax=Plakobranchus ocellatus TaxID=259542 RepID=A0AAV3ZEV7_9GAST|nr:neuropeptides capa receptor [Plakobranchus ocellatus]